jgi:hypothetical protein
MQRPSPTIGGVRLINKQIYGYSDMVLEHYSKESESAHSNPQSAQIKKRVISQGNENADKIVTKGLNIKNKPASIHPNSISSNFQKALDEQNDDYREVTQFLSTIKMEKYKDVFIDNGIEDRETILELNELHLEQMNLPLGHKLKILKKIKEAKKKDEENQPPVQLKPQQKSSSAEASSDTTSIQQSNNLLDGDYDEEANKREFQEALNAWRNTGKPEPHEEKKQPILSRESSATSSKLKSRKTVRFAEAPPEEVLILNEFPEEEVDDVATEIKGNKKPTTEIREGMIAFKGLSLSKNSFLFSDEANGSTFWNADLLSTVDHIGTSPRERELAEKTPIVKPEKEL